MQIRIVLIEPENEGNVGRIARVMKNFGFKNLWLTNPKINIGIKAKASAMHALDILSDVKIVTNFNSAINGCMYVAGTTSISAMSSSNLLRISISPELFSQRISDIDGEVGIIFGRESRGLSNEELAKCDLIITIPTNPEYKSLNISNAVAIILYELYKSQVVWKNSRLNNANPEERLRIRKLFNNIIIKTNMPEYRRRMAERVFSNLISRSFASSREITIIMGVLRKVSHILKKEI